MLYVLLSPESSRMLSPGTTSFEEVGRPGGNSGKANLVNLATVDQAESILNISTIGILHQINLCCGGRPVHDKMAEGVPGLYPPDSRSTSSSPLIVSTKNVSRHFALGWVGCKIIPTGEPLYFFYLSKLNTVMLSVKDIVYCPIIWAQIPDIRVFFGALLRWLGIISFTLGVWYS